MIELNKPYTCKELALELGISYQTFRRNKIREEKHLRLFYDYNIIKQGNSIIYTFNEQYADFIPYKEYKKISQNNLFKTHIEKTIECDPRQTGSNIARIIIVDEEIKALNLKLSTVTIYVRDNLKEMLEKGLYIKDDYRWCYLDKKADQYVLMSDSQVKELRSFFKESYNALLEQQENILTERKEGTITREEANSLIGEMQYKNFVNGLQKYRDIYNVWPIKVPVYVRAPWACGNPV